jgi:hypothetical protein
VVLPTPPFWLAKETIFIVVCTRGKEGDVWDAPFAQRRGEW